MNEPNSPDRRGFVRMLALGAISTNAVAHAADEPKPAKPAAPIDPVEARMELILARFGKHPQLDDKARAAIRDQVATIVQRGELLRSFPLDNGDGPFTVFHPFRPPAS